MRKQVGTVRRRKQIEISPGFYVFENPDPWWVRLWAWFVREVTKLDDE
jgi:hypothetical protein